MKSVPFKLDPDGDDTAGKIIALHAKGFGARAVSTPPFVSEDPASRAVQERIERLAGSDATVLIVGETGTGKELAARHLHRLSDRRAQPFIAVNCAALPESLVESELFGHERGAFTGAAGQRKGWFEAADGGTLFLDELGDLPLATQVKILRVLQEREIHRLGSRAPVSIDVRVIAATNVNLEDAVRAGRFREDLYYRLNVAKLSLPPLRDRPGDILPLAYTFLRAYQEQLGLNSAVLSDEARDAILKYSWPGNVRELENVIHHALIITRDGVIGPYDLNFGGPVLAPSVPVRRDAAPPSSGLVPALQDIFAAGGPAIFTSIEETVIRTAYMSCNENQVRTASLLGISRNILRHRLKLYGLI